MLPQRREPSRVGGRHSPSPPGSSSVPWQQAAAPCRLYLLPPGGPAFGGRRPLLLSTQLSACCMPLASGGCRALSKHSRGRRVRLLLVADASCACRRGGGGRGRSVARNVAATAARRGLTGKRTTSIQLTRIEVDREEQLNFGDDPEVQQIMPGDGKQLTPEQEAAFVELLASPTYTEAQKKQLVLGCLALGGNVWPVLQQRGLGLDWLKENVDVNMDLMDEMVASSAPLQQLWIDLTRDWEPEPAYEDEVIGRLRAPEPSARAPKRGFGGTAAGSSDGKGRRRKNKAPRQPKSSYDLAMELAVKEEYRRLRERAMLVRNELAAIFKITNCLTEEWPLERQADYVVLAVSKWLTKGAMMIGVGAFFRAALHPRSTASSTMCAELLLAIRRHIWRYFDNFLAHQRKKEVDVATSEPAMPPATKAEAIAGIRNILAHKTAQAIKAAIGLAKVEGASSGALNVEPGSVSEGLSEFISVMSGMHPDAAVQATDISVRTAEELLVDQVEVDWEAWQELPLHLRLETMVNPDWLPYQEFVNRRLAVMNEEQRREAAHHLGLFIEVGFWDPPLVAYYEELAALQQFEEEAARAAQALSQQLEVLPEASQLPGQQLEVPSEPSQAPEEGGAVLPGGDCASATILHGAAEPPAKPGLLAGVDSPTAAAEAEGEPVAELQPASPQTMEAMRRMLKANLASASSQGAAISATEPIEAGANAEADACSPAADVSDDGAIADASPLAPASEGASAEEEQNSAEKAAAGTSSEGLSRELSDPGTATGEAADIASSVGGAALHSLQESNGAVGRTTREDAPAMPSGWESSRGWTTLDWSSNASSAADSAASSAASSAAGGSRSQRANRPQQPDQRVSMESEARPSQQDRQQRQRREATPSGKAPGSKLSKLTDVQADWDGRLLRPKMRRRITFDAHHDGSYMAKQLLPHDKRHWKAAGILLFSRAPDGALHLLLGRTDVGPSVSAHRRRADGWWILGGKRDPADFCAEATAIREMTEETAGILSGFHICGDMLGEVLWYPPGDYALFPYLLPDCPDIPGRYARARATRGRHKGRRRPAFYRTPGFPRPMSALGWIPLRDLIEGRCRSHWILEDMLRRTPLLPYLLQMEQLVAEKGGPAGEPRSGAKAFPKSYRDPPGHADAQKKPRGISLASGSAKGGGGGGGRVDRTVLQRNGSATSGSEAVASSSSNNGWATADVADGVLGFNNMPAADVLPANGSTAAAAAVATEAAGAGLARPLPPRPEQGTPRDAAEVNFAAVARAAKDFLKASGVDPEDILQEEGGKEAPQKTAPPAWVPPLSTPQQKAMIALKKRRRHRFKRSQSQRSA